MWIISKSHIPTYIKGVIIYNILNGSQENSKNEEKKNFTIFSQRISGKVPKGLIKKKENQLNFY